MPPVAGKGIKSAADAKGFHRIYSQTAASGEFIHTASNTGIPHRRLNCSGIAVADRVNRNVPGECLDSIGVAAVQTFHISKSHADSPAVFRFNKFRCTVPAAYKNIDRQYGNAMAFGIVHDCRRRIKTHGPGIEQPAGEESRIFYLEPCCGVGNQGKTGRMGFRKPVLSEALYLAVHGFGKLRKDPFLNHSGNQPFSMPGKSTRASPGTHIAPKLIGLSRTVVGGDNGQFHHLLLKQRNAQSFFQHRLQ